MSDTTNTPGYSSTGTGNDFNPATTDWGGTFTARDNATNLSAGEPDAANSGAGDNDGYDDNNEEGYESQDANQGGASAGEPDPNQQEGDTATNDTALPWHKDPRFKDQLGIIKQIEEAGGATALQELLAFRELVPLLKQDGYENAQAVIEANQRIQREQYEAQMRAENEAREAQEQAERAASEAEIQEQYDNGGLSDEAYRQLMQALDTQAENKRFQQQLLEQGNYINRQLTAQAIATVRAPEFLPNMSPNVEKLLRLFKPEHIPEVARDLRAQIDQEVNAAIAKYAADKQQDRRKPVPQRSGSDAAVTPNTPSDVPIWQQSWGTVMDAVTRRR